MAVQQPAPVGAVESADPLERLRESEELNRRILEVVPGGVVHVAADGAIRSANAEACRILGLTFDALTQRYTLDFETETVREDGSPFSAVDYPVSVALRTGERAGPVTLGVRRPDGKTSWAVFTAVPVKTMGRVDGAVVTFLDITDRRNAELEVRESEARWRALLESTPAIIFTTDLEGHILQINRVLPELEMSSVIGTSVLAFVDPKDEGVVSEAIRRVAETGEIVGYECRGPPGLPAARYSVRVAPVTVDGAVVSLTFNALDVTEQHDLQRRIVVSDRMASVGTLAAGIAHEINNPLTFLISNLSWVLRDLENAGTCDIPANLARLRHAAEGADRIRDIVRDLSTFAKSRDGEPTPVDLHQVIESSIRMATNELRYRARLVRQFANVPPVLANASRLGQVVLNLLVNAGQAIVEGAADQNEVRVRTGVAPDGRVFVEVTDTGAGIAENVMDRIFEPFVTTKGEASGTGLGLYICHNVVRALGGEITAANVPSGGARLTVLLPAAGAPAELPPSTEETATACDRLSVLVVDDEEGVRRVLSHVLRKHHDVTFAASGREALERIQRGAFDVVLCDLIMPDMTGMDVYEHLRGSSSGLASKTVFMTGGAFTPRAQTFLERWDGAVLHKPFREAEVLHAVQAASVREPKGSA